MARRASSAPGWSTSGSRVLSDWTIRGPFIARANGMPSRGIPRPVASGGGRRYPWHMSAPPLELRPWSVCEPRVDLDRLGATEALFSLGNGYLGVRGTLDEGEPCVFHGTFHAGVFETFPLSYPEGGYGHPEEGQAMVGVADATPQADLVLALWWCRDDFTEEELARDLDYYEARTVRDSS